MTDTELKAFLVTDNQSISIAQLRKIYTRGVSDGRADALDEAIACCQCDMPSSVDTDELGHNEMFNRGFIAGLNVCLECYMSIVATRIRKLKESDH